MDLTGEPADPGNAHGDVTGAATPARPPSPLVWAIVEAAVYFCALEALQNVQKYAAAGHATVRLRELDGEVELEVEDNGRGFEARSATRGAGLTNMIDRLEALGGRLEIQSRPGEGARVKGVVPIGGSRPPGGDGPFPDLRRHPKL